MSCAFCEKNVTAGGLCDAVHGGPPNASFNLRDSLRFSYAVAANEEEIEADEDRRVPLMPMTFGPPMIVAK